MYKIWVKVGLYLTNFFNGGILIAQFVNKLSWFAHNNYKKLVKLSKLPSLELN